MPYPTALLPPLLLTALLLLPPTTARSIGPTPLPPASSAPLCSVAFCTRHGAAAACVGPDHPTADASCAAWHTHHANPIRDLCAFPCAKVCMPLSARPLGSDGIRYCSPCHLRFISCGSAFQIYGPVDDEQLLPDPSADPADDDESDPDLLPSPEDDDEPQPTADTEDPADSPTPDDCNAAGITPLNAFSCCATHATGCLPLDTSCSTAGSMVPMPACEAGLGCVLSDFGRPATDVPNAGRCVPVAQEDVPVCDIAHCARNGAAALCTPPEDPAAVATCGAWAVRDDGFPRPVCSFVCTLECNIGPTAPVGSDGKRYCSECQLRSISCVTNFDVYGPL